jgi:hypothetical protein
MNVTVDRVKEDVSWNEKKNVMERLHQEEKFEEEN